ncbi:ceramidase domain-containing protein [Amycolatopsis sp. PS_44_ISF1]|uniref:ceramidase domain-containing protein n=1 Tax=Amycolatopsis sp. PS_44_ISF1 TaxID=2974917 RepID=UPI0028DD8986|nr:ceramidase domain-containing protein [Amycolatopsis sp. PS_44_ISF1]MDT8911973.1 ceramidase [Amycolatopsis sp. PS_44_ISF1]
MPWPDHLDDYCERVSPAFWAEPVNALSNAVFLLAAVLLWRAQRRAGPPVPVDLTVLTGLMATIGVGSFVFHTLATRWSQGLDVAPIGLFVCCYLAAYFHWFWQWRWRRAGLAVLGFATFCGVTAAGFGSHSLNGSLPYLPVLATLAGLTVALARSADPERAEHWPAFASAAILFAGALVFRSVDTGICAWFPLGTHFLWHLLNGAVLFVLGRALTRRWRQVTSRTGSGPGPA